MIKYRANGLVERLFVVWILLLAMLFGTNTPCLFDDRDSSNAVIIFFFLLSRPPVQYISLRSAGNLSFEVAFAALIMPPTDSRHRRCLPYKSWPRLRGNCDRVSDSSFSGHCSSGASTRARPLRILRCAPTGLNVSKIPSSSSWVRAYRHW